MLKTRLPRTIGGNHGQSVQAIFVKFQIEGKLMRDLLSEAARERSGQAPSLSHLSDSTTEDDGMTLRGQLNLLNRSQIKGLLENVKQIYNNIIHSPLLNTDRDFDLVQIFTERFCKTFLTC